MINRYVFIINSDDLIV